MTDGPFLWYLNRSTGLVILVLLSASMVLGVLSLGGRPGGRVPRFVTQSLHRNLSLLAVVVLLVHISSAVADTFVDIRWWQALVPVGATYEPLWLGLGTLSLDLIVVVVVTSLLRSRLGHSAWHVVHLVTWLAWALAIAHTVGIGTDVKGGTGWAVVPTIVCVAAVLGAAVLRVVRGPRSRTTMPALAPPRSVA
ncbi:MAG: Ferric reductase domain protein transrane component, N-terminal domain [Nocardioides sp.]|nr:Ferric reductase domain protein transrane component, N-terminal domain [Nocardioides sp.]